MGFVGKQPVGCMISPARRAKSADQRKWRANGIVLARIAAAYWFTASTSFANPAATIARHSPRRSRPFGPPMSDLFIAARFLGAVASMLVCHGSFRANQPKTGRSGSGATRRRCDARFGWNSGQRFGRPASVCHAPMGCPQFCTPTLSRCTPVEASSHDHVPPGLSNRCGGLT